MTLSRTDFATGNLPQAVVARDFNGDGKPDLAVANGSDNTVSILLGNGDGTFKPQAVIPVPGDPVALIAADFNGDGRLDLVIVDQRLGLVSILRGNGDGTFQAQHVYGTAADPLALVAGDFNGDGKLDLALASNNLSAVSVLLGSGDGTLLPISNIPPRCFPTPLSPPTSTVTAGSTSLW